MYAIEAVELGKRFGGFWAVKSVTFSIRERCIVVLAGPNGAGKTTTVRMLTTVFKPSKGFARVMGFDVVKEFKEVRKRIAYLPQDYGSPGDITPFEFIIYTLMMRGFSYFDARKEARKWIELLGLEKVAKNTLRVLSGGERRKTLVAATLASNADVVLLDEPTTGLDVEARYMVLKAIKDSTKILGSTVMLTTHMLEEGQLVADYVVFINSGEVVARGEPEELLVTVPYRYRVILEGISKKCLRNRYIDLGEKVITWTRNEEEARQLADVCRPSSFLVRDVTLEDVYLYIVGEKR
uniref:ABC transporter ATP-binding protein n=1 Tax=Ignisphaera aggregans TaxID=334771 RepID=A0A7J2U2D1_9CREN